MISLTYEVGRYRRLLSETVREGDVVVEIGPHVGRSTDMYVGKASKVVLVDKGRDCAGALEKYSLKHNNVIFVLGDARGFDTLSLVLKHAKSCDVLAVDLGGGRYPDTVFKVWASWSGVMRPRYSIIRCRGLAEFVKRAKVADDTIPDSFKDSGWLQDYGRATPSKLKDQLREFEHWIELPK
ncbi:MAG: SAM-dependent methyltransferase [Candidatus Altiarchaeota archaeon]